MNKKKIVILLSILSILTLLIFVGSSYAMFVKTEEALNDNEYTTGILKITYSSNGAIELSKLPLSIEEGKNTTPYNFSVENTGNIGYQYSLKLVTDTTYATNDGCLNNQVPSKYIQVMLDDGEPTLLSNLSEGTFISDVFINPGEKQTYNLRAWLDSSTPNSVIGAHFHAVIVSSGYGVSLATCNTGYVYSEVVSSCIKEATLVESNTCPLGYTMNGDVCEATLTCEDGYTLSGSTCQKEASLASYSCDAGTISGSSCVQSSGSYYSCSSGTLSGSKCTTTDTVWTYQALGPYSSSISCSGHRCTDAGYDGGSQSTSSGKYYCDCYTTETSTTWADQECYSCPSGWTRLSSSDCTCTKSATANYYCSSSSDTLTDTTCQYTLSCPGTLNGTTCSIDKTTDSSYMCLDGGELIQIDGVSYCKVATQ